MGNVKNINLGERVVACILGRKTEELPGLTGAGIAGYFGVDEPYLATTFEREQHISLAQYILREKIYRALFIIEKNHKITDSELAARLGFTEYAVFDREFRKFFLIEPAKYIDLRKKLPRRPGNIRI